MPPLAPPINPWPWPNLTLLSWAKVPSFTFVHPLPSHLNAAPASPTAQQLLLDEHETPLIRKNDPFTFTFVKVFPPYLRKPHHRRSNLSPRLEGPYRTPAVPQCPTSSTSCHPTWQKTPHRPSIQHFLRETALHISWCHPPDSLLPSTPYYPTESALHPASRQSIGPASDNLIPHSFPLPVPCPFTGS